MLWMKMTVESLIETEFPAEKRGRSQ